jgi:uracil-DNA glycosylase
MINIEESWKRVLEDEFTQPYMDELRNFLQLRRDQGASIYPPTKLWFNAFNTTPFDKVKVVILGQDPYHGAGQAHGLSFSVPAEIKKRPPSLNNIYSELKSDLSIVNSSNTLTSWAEQGVLLLNSVLTVEAREAGSHQNRGWEHFTDKVIEKLNSEKKHLVFILWGSYAQKKGRHIDHKLHRVISSPHPSPLSAYRGFFGSRPFSKTNQYLTDHEIKQIEWQL